MNLDIPNVVVMLGIYVLMRQRLKKARKKKRIRDSTKQSNGKFSIFAGVGDTLHFFIQ